jgi:hypothetical protein
MDVRNPKPINKETMCGDDEWECAKCPGCEYEFKIKKEAAIKECPNCEQEFDVEEFIAFYNESNK